jgi:hypothetical protein
MVILFMIVVDIIAYNGFIVVMLIIFVIIVFLVTCFKNRIEQKLVP